MKLSPMQVKIQEQIVVVPVIVCFYLISLFGLNELLIFPFLSVYFNVAIVYALPDIVSIICDPTYSCTQLVVFTFSNNRDVS